MNKSLCTKKKKKKILAVAAHPQEGQVLLPLRAVAPLLLVAGAQPSLPAAAVHPQGRPVLLPLGAGVPLLLVAGA